MLVRSSFSRMNSVSQPALLVPGHSIPAVVPARGRARPGPYAGGLQVLRHAARLESKAEHLDRVSSGILEALISLALHESLTRWAVVGDSCS